MSREAESARIWKTPTPIAIERGAIYFVNFNPSKGTEAGKIRSALVVQSDLLNEVGHPSTTVVPLTTQLIDGAAPLRLRIAARDRLAREFDLMLDQIRTIDNRRFNGEMLTRLEGEEMMLVEEYLRILLGLE